MQLFGQGYESDRNNIIGHLNFEPYPHQQPGEVLIQEELQLIPHIYPCYKRSNKDRQFQRRIKNCLRQFTQKYGIESKNQQTELKNKVIQIQRMTPKARGVRECTGVVVFMAIRGHQRISFKSFCRDNQLQTKISNRKYKLYFSLFQHDQLIQALERNQTGLGIKVEERVQQFKNSQIYAVLYGDKNLPLSFQPIAIVKNKPVSQCNPWLKSLETIYSSIFKEYYFKHHQTEIIKKMIQRIESLGINFLISLGCTIDNPQIYYYVIFVFLKYLNLNIGFTAYSLIVLKNVGYSLDKNKIKDFKHIIKFSQQTTEQSEQSSEMQLVEVNEVKQEVNWPRSQIRMVQSPQILQQQLFSFQNCYYFPHDSNSYN